jgi:hypothetical protein
MLFLGIDDRFHLDIFRSMIIFCRTKSHRPGGRARHPWGCAAFDYAASWDIRRRVDTPGIYIVPHNA